jgi:hypothetical protein
MARLGGSTFEVIKLADSMGVEIEPHDARAIMDRVGSWTSREDLHAKIREELARLQGQDPPAV